MATDPAIRDHQTWLGYLQPDGLVVSPAALVDAQVLLDQNTIPLQQRFLDFVREQETNGQVIWSIENLNSFLTSFLEWPEDCAVGLNGGGPIPESLKIPLKEFGETLEPSIAFKDPNANGNDKQWLLLVKHFPEGTDLDESIESAMAGWSASRTRRFERLLRETEIPIGLIFTGTHIRIVYAPRGENAGTLTFPVAPMVEIAGRPILAAMEMLLSGYRLISAPSEARLPALLKRSRDYQSRVSTALAKQVLDALYDLLRGFQAANDHSKGTLLKNILEKQPDDVYNGLLTVLMRIVFLLYAEDRAVMPSSNLYVGNYSIHTLFQRLRQDADQYPDTMDHRYGAWAQLCALFRAVYDGCQHPHLKIPARHGHLFDPDRFLFLEGITTDDQGLPLVSDGVIHRVLSNLLVLDGERLSYRTLDVEQIGSVYETMMGFRLEITSGQTIALKPAKAHGAPVPVNLENLLDAKPAARAKLIKDQTDYKTTAKVTKAVKDSTTINDLLVSLEKRIARNATPQPVPAGTMVLMPTDERRKSGSHYTPRSLTQPIVEKALEPILKQLGEKPPPDDILNLKICDPAMGSGAFLVEACRQLADALVQSWSDHGYEPLLPEDEDIVLYARRMVAQRCLYGVDRNPMAVDLAKLSLWLATLARDHPFTFLDHSLRCGDSLVGLTRDQIIGFHWTPTEQREFLETDIRKSVERASKFRRRILEAGDQMLPTAKREQLDKADEALDVIRMAGDLVIAAFFSADKAREREDASGELRSHLENFYRNTDAKAFETMSKALDDLREGPLGIKPFHWEIEYPEVFCGNRPGFDSIVGNPPFAGKNTLLNSHREGYLDWLKEKHAQSHGNADLVAHFFRRTFDIIRFEGTFGLLATNTIGQGDTRASGLRYICTNGGVIYSATKRFRWPGMAAVIVSIVHVAKGTSVKTYHLNGRDVTIITAYLFHAGGHENPRQLLSNKDICFQGVCVLGMGFTFDDTGTNEMASPISEMRRLIKMNPDHRNLIQPYIGGEEILNEPDHSHHRYIINFDQWPLARRQTEVTWQDASNSQRKKWVRDGIVPLDYPEPVAEDYPELLRIIIDRVKPERVVLKDRYAREKWWQYLRPRPELQEAKKSLKRVLTTSRVGNAYAFCFVDASSVLSDRLVVFCLEEFSNFSIIQSRVHETWARFFGSTLKDDLMYALDDCFGTFPFPEKEQATASLEDIGSSYYQYRAKLMATIGVGLTKIYNRFHDPNESAQEIQKLRELHSQLDRAVLDSYGWTDIDHECEFLLDFEEDDEEGGTSRKRKPWRYRWPDEIHDDVLARLLKLNAERAEEEHRAGKAAGKNKKWKAKSTTNRRKKKVASENQTKLNM